jgi:uncharacterized protein (TIGR02246 family)
MRRTLTCSAALVIGMLLPLTAARAQDNKKEEPAHEELRTLRKQLVDAVNKGDMDALLTHLDKDVVVTWMDGRVSRGPQGVKEYIKKMTKGADRKVQSYKTEAEVDELTHLYGDTGIATGKSHDQFVLTDGRDFATDARWTASLVKSDGQWKVAAFHASTDMFDNPVLHLAMHRTALWTGIPAGVAGLVVGAGAIWLLRPRRT